MLLRHLIVLIIYIRNACQPSYKLTGIIGLNDRHVLETHGNFLIGQIKLTRIHEFKLLSPGCGSNKEFKLLFTMSKDPVQSPRRR